MKYYSKFSVFIFLVIFFIAKNGKAQNNMLTLNDQDYFEMQGLNVMLFHDNYPEGHQVGVTIIQHGVRVAANGDLRLEPTPGQWQPVPAVGERVVDREKQVLTVPCSYPDPERDRIGFNPIEYPDLELKYRVNVKAESVSVRITVDLEEPLPAEWIGKVGFNLELFPGTLFGKSFAMDGQTGIFPRQLNGPMTREQDGSFQIKPMAVGAMLVVAPEDDSQRLKIESKSGVLQLIDGRAHHNNGWFVVRTPVPAGALKNAIEWIVTPNVIPNWKCELVIHVSQVGYHPKQKKMAVIESDPADEFWGDVSLQRIHPSGELETIRKQKPEKWGRFLRYQYYRFDFSAVRENGMYQISYGKIKTHPFKISSDVFDRHVWQPTLEYFLPVQMCHVRVNDRYRVWHGLCHLDDALMAPPDTNHFDGYKQGPSTLTSFKALEHVPGLNVGGWHDAGDYDLRVESQATTVRTLSLIYEIFKIDYDETTIDQQNRLVELHQPDGKPDVLQQVEHGVLSILAGYKNLGRLYRGIICPDLRQYVLLGDGSTMTDNNVAHHDSITGEMSASGTAVPDERWVFTEENPQRELFVAGCLAAASRALAEYDNQLAVECLRVAEELWETNKKVEKHASAKIEALAELILATGKSDYKDQLIKLSSDIKEHLGRVGWLVGRVIPVIDDKLFVDSVTDEIRSYHQKLEGVVTDNPFNVPYRPRIWGAGWDIQHFGVHQYFLYQGFPDIFSKDYVLNALNFILGCHPGQNTASFVSGVGSNSVTVAYGVNRADWSYIPGGVVSGTGIIRPDFPELKEWPFLWQQTEYMVGGAGSNFMFLVLAANELMEDD